MIIEFIGTPGAGKTTLVPTVIDTLQMRGIRAYTVVEAARVYAQRTYLWKVCGRFVPESLQRPILWRIFYYCSVIYRLKFVLCHLKLIRHVIKSQKGRPQSADIKSRKILYWYFRMVGYYEFLKAYIQPDEALIFDEGFVHRVVQLNTSGVEEPNPEQILTYVDLLPQPDQVIFIQAPYDVCENRIYQRGLWDRFRHKDTAEISNFVANAWLIVNLAAKHIKDKGWAIVEIDNGADDLDASKAELSRLLLPGAESQILG